MARRPIDKEKLARADRESRIVIAIERDELVFLGQALTGRTGIVERGLHASADAIASRTASLKVHDPLVEGHPGWH